jgi:hypothetical protein
MTTSDATAAARRLVAELGQADEPTRKLAAVVLLLADEVDRLTAEVGRLARKVRL